MKKKSNVQRQVEALVETLQNHAQLVAKMTGSLADLPQLAADTIECGAVESLAHAKSLLTLIASDPKAEATIVESRMTRASINRHKHYAFAFTENVGGNKRLLNLVEITLMTALDRAEAVVAAIC